MMLVNVAVHHVAAVSALIDQSSKPVNKKRRAQSPPYSFKLVGLQITTQLLWYQRELPPQAL